MAGTKARNISLTTKVSRRVRRKLEKIARDRQVTVSSQAAEFIEQAVNGNGNHKATG